MFEIEAVNAYPETYDGLLDVSLQEISENTGRHTETSKQGN